MESSDRTVNPKCASLLETAAATADGEWPTITLEQQRNDNAFKLEQQRNDSAFKLESRRANHRYVSDQIQFLYGPLMSLCNARDAAMIELFRLQRPDLRGKTGDFFDKTERTPEQLKQWRLWREVVFLPLLVKMQETVVQNAHLIDETELPHHFGDLMAHVSTYNVIIKNWADVIEKDQKEKTSKIDEQRKNVNDVYETVVPHIANENFPRDFHKAVEAKFKELKLKTGWIDRKCIDASTLCCERCSVSGRGDRNANESQPARGRRSGRPPADHRSPASVEATQRLSRSLTEHRKPSYCEAIHKPITE